MSVSAFPSKVIVAFICTLTILSPTYSANAVDSPVESTRRRRAAGPAAPSAHEVRRFLQQATFGPTNALVERVRKIGFEGYLEEQFRAPISGYPEVPTQFSTPGPDCDARCIRDRYTPYPLQKRFFVNALYGEDQLRQRVSWALHKIFVIAGNTINEPKAITPYLQVIDRNAFGNYRDLLYEMTLNPSMGAYLNMVTSTRSNPNENYAREILQLFSTGTVLLNRDGTPKLDQAGNPIATYDQPVVDGFTKAFTGWTWAPARSGEDRNDFQPMQPGSGTHDTGTKLLLNGVVLPANQSTEKDLHDAIDNIFHHPNVAPFVSRQLIQNLVTSNPSSEYVQRVSAVFDDNGGGVRGDLKAVLRAILLDPEARRSGPLSTTYGHLKEPVLFVTNVLRAFGARSTDGRSLSDGFLNPHTATMGQDVFIPPSVFSYYPPDYLTPGAPDVLGPEFGIVSAATLVARINFIERIVFHGIAPSDDAPNGTSLDLGSYVPLASDPTSLVEELNAVLMYGRMSPEMKTTIVEAVTAVPAAEALLRVRQAIYLVCTSAQFQVVQ